MKRWMGRILLCLIFLTGGAVTTVAVAWTCAVVIDVGRERQHGFVQTEDELWAAQRYEKFGSLQLRSERIRTGSKTRAEGEAPRVLLRGRPTLLQPTDTYLQAGYSHEDRFCDGRGFPGICLWVERRSVVTGRDMPPVRRWDRGGIVLSSKFASTGEKRILPLIPSIGFLIDTLFYALIWFGLFFGFTSAKRAIRRGRGRCPMCGYDLRGHRHEGAEASRHQGIGPGCPECGWNRTKETAP